MSQLKVPLQAKSPSDECLPVHFPKFLKGLPMECFKGLGGTIKKKRVRKTRHHLNSFGKLFQTVGPLSLWTAFLTG